MPRDFDANTIQKQTIVGDFQVASMFNLPPQGGTTNESSNTTLDREYYRNCRFRPKSSTVPYLGKYDAKLGKETK